MTQGDDPVRERGERQVPRWMLLGAFSLSGAAALTYEVVWTRALSVILGSTTYAVSSMLATFMLGLAVGGFAGGRIADRTRRVLVWIGAAELGIAVLGIGSHLVIEALPQVYLAAYRALHLSAAGYFVAQIAICSAVMLLPTVLMGMTFPLVTRAVVCGMDDVGRATGYAYASNTLGSVVGAWLAGFVLVPNAGLRGTTLAAAGLNALVATVLLVRGGGVRVRAALAALLLLPIAAALTFGHEHSSRLVNFYSARRYLGGARLEVIERQKQLSLSRLYEHEGADGYVAAYRDRDQRLILQVGGKLEGTSAADAPNAELAALLPAAAHTGARRMLVIGLGAGVTLEVARSLVPSVDLAEINGDVLEAVRRHGPPGLLDGLRVFREDARNLLLKGSERWDVISSEPSYPTDFAVANLFSREFYELAASRLERGGVFCQWLPYYLMTNDEMTMMVKTFASVFPSATLWKVSGSMDRLLIGSREPFARDREAIVARVAQFRGGRITLELSRDAGQVLEIAARSDVPVNTDDRPRLEFGIVHNLRVGDMDLVERSRSKGAE